MNRILWEKGGEASLLSIETDAVRLSSTVPSPPGSRIEGTVEGSSARVRVKIHGSRLQPDGRFLLEGRSLDMTREVREMLRAMVVTPT